MLSAKWVIPVIAVLTSGPRTHTEIYRAVGPGVSQKVLTETLRRMQDAGLLTRGAGSGGAAGAYELTQAGKTVLGPLEALAVWRIRTMRYFSGGVSGPTPRERQSLDG